MRRLVVLAPLAFVLALVLGGTAQADRNGIVRFATLPSGPGHPEGVAADPAGNIYAATFSFSPPNFIYRFDRSGQLTATVTLPASVPLGMQWGPDNKLYVDDFGNGNVLQFTPPITNASTPSRVYHVCTGGGSACGLNAITFDRKGLLYTSDSFGGRIFRFDPASTPTINVAYIASDLLKPGSHGFPPFGANGLAFKNDDLFVANTADDTILKSANAANTPTAPVVFVQSINGVDGINFDPATGLLWACANQENTLYVIDVTRTDVNGAGLVADIRGSFEGIGPDGAPRGLLFPASIVFSRGSVFITNTALDFRHHFTDERPVTRFTISRVPLGDGERGD